MDSDRHAVPAIGRREFLLGLSVAAAGSPLVRAEIGRAEHTTSPAPLLPTIHLGDHLKPTDGVIVGMYPRYQNQIRQNAGYTRKFASTQQE